MNGQPNPGAWLGLGLVLVVLANFGLAEPIRLSLIAVLLYVLLTESAKWAPALNRFAAALGGAPAQASGPPLRGMGQRARSGPLEFDAP